MMRLSAVRFVFALSCGWCMLCTDVAEAQRSRRGAINQVARRLQREIKEIQKQMPEAREELGNAEKSLVRAQIQYRLAQAEIEQTRRTLNQRVGPKVGLPEAQARSDEARNAYEKASAKLILDRRDEVDFQKLRGQYLAAEERLNAFRKAQAADDIDRKEKLAALTKAAHQARDAYRSRIENDPAVKPAHEQWQEAEARLGEARKKLSQETKDDPDLKAAESAFKQAKTALQRAQAVAAVAGTRVALMQERIATNLALLGN